MFPTGSELMTPELGTKAVPERFSDVVVETPRAFASGFGDAWLLCRQAAMWGFLVGWMITPVENYGEAILRANLERLTAAIEDLETLSALSE